MKSEFLEDWENASALHSFLLFSASGKTRRRRKEAHWKVRGSACFTGSQGWPFLPFPWDPRSWPLTMSVAEPVSLRNQGIWGKAHGRAVKPEELLRFLFLMAGLEATMDLGSVCFPTGGHVRCQESELLSWLCISPLTSWMIRFLFKVNNHWPLFLKGSSEYHVGEYI